MHILFTRNKFRRLGLTVIPLVTKLDLCTFSINWIHNRSNLLHDTPKKNNNWINLGRFLQPFVVIYFLKTFFSSRVRDVLLSAFISVKLGNCFFLMRFPFVGRVKSTPVAALMSANKEGSCQSGTADLTGERTEEGSFGCPCSSRATIGPWRGHFWRSLLGHNFPLGSGALQVHLTGQNASLNSTGFVTRADVPGGPLSGSWTQ